MHSKQYLINITSSEDEVGLKVHPRSKEIEYIKSKLNVKMFDHMTKI